MSIYRDCVALQDPACAWDTKYQLCTIVKDNSQTKKMVQDILNGDTKKCRPEYVLGKMTL